MSLKSRPTKWEQEIQTDQDKHLKIHPPPSNTHLPSRAQPKHGLYPARAIHCGSSGVWVRVAQMKPREVFTLLHEFLRIPPDSQWKVGIPRNSMEFLWKAFGWSLSQLGSHFHGNSHFFPRNSDGNGRNPGASGNHSHGNPLDFLPNSMEFQRKLHSSQIPDGFRRNSARIPSEMR